MQRRSLAASTVGFDVLVKNCLQVIPRNYLNCTVRNGFHWSNAVKKRGHLGPDLFHFLSSENKVG